MDRKTEIRFAHDEDVGYRAASRRTQTEGLIMGVTYAAEKALLLDISAQAQVPKPHPDDWFIGPWGIKTRREIESEMGGKPSRGTSKDKRLKENRPDHPQPPRKRGNASGGGGRRKG